MMDKDITKKYSNEEITVVWKPKVCIHSENKPFCDGSHVKKEFKG
ncbi:MAG: CDGSH iron-sulfur domain-containing protein [Leptospiraceae bacterium]|nr:CDGSH iron-sulfur domain-containing protein [Leptospiraceae bacterium]